MNLIPRDFLLAIMIAGINAADPAQCMVPYLPAPPSGRTIVIGAGKAAAKMAKVVEDSWSHPLEGLVVTRYGHGINCERIEVVEAAHPVPDASGMAGARRILDLACSARADDLVLFLLSGGASALMSLPANNLTLHDKQRVNNELLYSGANISEINCVRKHLSAIKGGRLAAMAAPARIVTLAISDVPGDDPDVIGSGPTVPDTTTFGDAKEICRKYEIELPVSIVKYLSDTVDETPKPADFGFANTEFRLIATPQISLDAAAVKAIEYGVRPIILGNAIEGEAREVAKVMSGIARQVKCYGQPVKVPAVLLSGGETTVTVRGEGRGGRNTEFQLALAKALEGSAGIWSIAVDTDGIDGTENNAGAFVTPDTLVRGERLGINPSNMLADNNAYSFFQAIGDLVVTGPTLTNVNDFRAITVLPC